MNVRDIFLAVLDLPDSAGRAKYLDDACGGNQVLRARVEALLRSHDTAGNFLGKPAVAPPDALATEELGRAATPAESVDLSFLTPTQRLDSLGRIGHYEVLDVLGCGGFGIVFRAFDETLQRVVAVKVLAPQLAATSPARKRFLREARSSAQVRHDNVVQVYAVEEQPLPYLVMEFIPGQSLQQRLNRVGPLEITEVVRIGRQIAEGLAAAHSMNLIHRDIKPGNILIEAGPQQRVKITDFGMARAADDATATQSGIVAGTPMYMAPEQAKGETLDHRADLFSLGSVLYAMCSGRPPFRASSMLAVLKRVAEDTPRPIPEIIPEVPAWLCDIIARLHAKNPEERFASAQEVAEVLGRCQDQPPTFAITPRPGAAAPARTARGKRPWLAAALVVLALLCVLGVTEATDVTQMRGTVIRLFSPEGTLVVEVDDPGVSVTVEGKDIVITGAGVREVRLKPGQYKVEASKDGKVVRQELVSIEKNGQKVVRVSREAEPAAVGAIRVDSGASEWEKSVAALSADEQVKAVSARLKLLNPGFDGNITPTIENDVVIGLEFLTLQVTNISPVRALTGLQTLHCGGLEASGKLADLTPLRGMQLRNLNCNNTQVSDLAPLKGLPLKELYVQHTRVTELTPLLGMALEHLNCSHTRVADLSPLKGMKLQSLYLDGTKVTDLAPLRSMPLKTLNIRNYEPQLGRDRDILRSLNQLETINSDPADDFLKKLDHNKEKDKN